MDQKRLLKTIWKIILLELKKGVKIPQKNQEIRLTNIKKKHLFLFGFFAILTWIPSILIIGYSTFKNYSGLIELTPDTKIYLILLGIAFSFTVVLLHIDFSQGIIVFIGFCFFIIVGIIVRDIEFAYPLTLSIFIIFKSIYIYRILNNSLNIFKSIAPVFSFYTIECAVSGGTIGGMMSRLVEMGYTDQGMPDWYSYGLGIILGFISCGGTVNLTIMYLLIPLEVEKGSND